MATNFTILAGGKKLEKQKTFLPFSLLPGSIVLTRGRDKNLRCGLILQAFQVAYVVFYPEIMGCNSK